MTLSPLQIARYKYEPKLPPVLRKISLMLRSKWEQNSGRF
jgi:hypothetical protein